MLLTSYNLKVWAAVISLVIVILMSGFVYYQYQNELALARSAAQELDQEILRSVTTVPADILNRVFSDVKTISQLPAFKEYLADPAPVNAQRVADIFVAFSQNKKVYDQIRFIDDSGQEKIRVNNTLGKGEIIPEEKLQNKKGRYYFDEAYALSEGQIYVSPLDLNVEQNKVEEPYKPMLRIATPVFEQGEKKGILIINFLAQELIAELEKRIQFNADTSPISLNFINRDGYWFFGVPDEKLWGFMFDGRKDESVAKINPELWTIMESSTAGHYYAGPGLYSYVELTQPEVINQKWRLYLFDPNYNIYKIANWDNKKLLLAFVVLLLIFVALNVIFSFIINRARRVKEAQIEAENLYRNLYENSADSIMLIAPPNWNFISGNKATLDMFGCQTKEEFLRFTPEQLSPEKQNDGQSSKKKAKEMIDQALAKGTVSFEWTHQTIAGKLFLAHVTLGKVLVGDKTMVQAVVRDITQEKELSAIKEKQEEKVKLALSEAERFNKLMVGREMEMIALKKELAALRANKEKSN